jgi:uncharacterized protein (DUF427 family)
MVSGQIVADSINAVYLFEHGHLPVYYFPIRDVRPDVLVPSDTTTHCPRKGDARYWSIVVGDRKIVDAVWGYPEPIPSCPDISGYVAFYWDRVDAWFEEDEEVFVHARSPYHRVDVMQSSRLVQVIHGGEVIAESSQPRLLFETGLPTRFYLPKLDVRMDLLTPSDSLSVCPYKGQARYYNINVPLSPLPDGVWYYPAPIPECPKIQNYLCFYNEKVDQLLVDGVVQPKPVTRWS